MINEIVRFNIVKIMNDKKLSFSEIYNPNFFGNPSNLYKYIKGTRPISLTKLEQFCVVLKCSYKDLVETKKYIKHKNNNNLSFNLLYRYKKNTIQGYNERFK